MLHTVALAASLFTGNGAAPPPTVTKTDVERIAATVERALPRGRMLEAVVRRRLWQQKEGEAPPVVDRDPPGLEDRTFVRLWGEDHAVSSNGSSGGIRVYFKGTTYDVNLLEHDCYARPGVQSSAELGMAILFQVDNLWPIEQGDSLPEAIRASHPVSLAIDGSVATYRFTLASEERALDEQAAKTSTPRGKAWPREIVVDLGEPPRVLGWSLDMPWRGVDQPWQPMGWRVTGWQEFEGSPLPTRIERTMNFSRTDTPLAYTQRLDVERLAPLPADAKPTHPLPAGYPVDAGDLRFVVGSPDVIHKGNALRLKEPLWTLPEPARLEELLREARPR